MLKRTLAGLGVAAIMLAGCEMEQKQEGNVYGRSAELLNKVSKKLAEAQSEKVSVEKEIAAWEKAGLDSTARKGDLDVSTKDGKARLSSSITERDAKKARLSQIDASQAALETQNAVCKDLVNKKTKELADTRSTLAMLDAKKAEADKSLAEERAKADKTAKLLEGAKALISDAEKGGSKTDNLQAQAQEYERNLKDSRAKISELDMTINGIVPKAASLETSKVALTGELDTAQKNLADSTAKLENFLKTEGKESPELKGKLVTLDEQIAKLASDLATSDKNLSSAEATMKESSEKLIILKRRNAQLDEDIKTYSSQNDRLGAVMKKVDAEFETVKDLVGETKKPK